MPRSSPTDAADLFLDASADSTARAIDAKLPATPGGARTMSEISRAALFGKLNPLAYKAIEGATVFCKLRGNPYVELVHWLQQILQHAGLRPAPHRPAFRARPGAAGRAT